MPVREAERFQKEPGLAAELDPITRVILIQMRADLAFADKNVRLAAHHAIDKAALSKAFYAGAAVPLSVLATPGTPGYLTDFSFKYDPALAKELLAKSNFSTANPVKIGFATTNGQFPSDYDIARAIVQMWKQVGIEADLQTIEYAKYFELNRGNKLPETTLYSWDNATGDPEIFSGYQLNPKMPFSPWKDEDIGNRVLGAVRRRRLRQAHRRLSRPRTLRGGKRRHRAAVAERGDDRAQEEPGLYEICQWLGAAADVAVELSRCHAPPTGSGPKWPAR